MESDPIDFRTQAQIDADQARIGKFTFGTVMMATGVGIYGLPTLGAFGTGTAIGGTVSAGVQYTTKGKVEVADTIYGGLTGGLTMGQSIIPSLVINTGGAISSSAFSTDSASSSAAGAVAGTTFGAGVDTGLDSTLKYLPNNKYTQPIKASIQVLKPIASSAAGEYFGNAVKDKASQ